MTSLLCVIPIEKQMTVTSPTNAKQKLILHLCFLFVLSAVSSLQKPHLVDPCHDGMSLQFFSTEKSKLDYSVSDHTVMLFFQIFNN